MTSSETEMKSFSRKNSFTTHAKLFQTVVTGYM